MQINSFWLAISCFVFLIMSILLSGIIPVGIYLLTGRARTTSLKTRRMIIMEGRRALQFVIFRFSFHLGIVIAFLGIVFEYRFWWIGFIVTVFSIPFVLTATIDA
jgi:hypothetical protein